MTNQNVTARWPHQALNQGAGLVLARTVVEVTGDAATSYLNGQLSQDVANLEIGTSAYSFVLEPQGKVDVWFRITRLGENRFLLDTDAGWNDALTTRLERFRLNTPVQFQSLNHHMLAIRLSPDADTSAEVLAVVEELAAANLCMAVHEDGYFGWDVLGENLNVPVVLAPLDVQAFDALRIEAGLPAMGKEITNNTIPAATRMVERSVSFTKGCYTGQELVARMDSRGNRSPQQLVGLVFDGNESAEVGSEIFLKETNESTTSKAIGEVTSVAPVGSHGRPVALAYVARAVELPALVVVGAKELPAQSFVPMSFGLG